MRQNGDFTTCAPTRQPPKLALRHLISDSLDRHPACVGVLVSKFTGESSNDHEFLLTTTDIDLSKVVQVEVVSQRVLIGAHRWHKVVLHALEPAAFSSLVGDSATVLNVGVVARGTDLTVEALRVSAAFRVVDGLDIVRLVLERMFEVATVVRSVLLLRLINCDASCVTRDRRIFFDLSIGQAKANHSYRYLQTSFHF